jgi:hypothetical protein
MSYQSCRYKKLVWSIKFSAALLEMPVCGFRCNKWLKENHVKAFYSLVRHTEFSEAARYVPTLRQQLLDRLCKPTAAGTKLKEFA